MDGEDKVITCRTCETPFVFSAGEQEFFALKGLKNIPVRCPNCRTSLKLFKKGKAADEGADVPCYSCGEITRHTCFHKQKEQAVGKTLENR